MRFAGREPLISFYEDSGNGQGKKEEHEERTRNVRRNQEALQLEFDPSGDRRIGCDGKIARPFAIGVCGEICAR